MAIPVTLNGMMDSKASLQTMHKEAARAMLRAAADGGNREHDGERFYGFHQGSEKGCRYGWER